LVQAIDAGPWRTDLARRTQHYGFIYDYKAKSVNPAVSLGPLPPWLAGIAERALSEGLCAERPDQAIINEYLSGQGIAAHVDCKPSFAETVMSLSLISPVMMDFKNGQQTTGVWIEPRSLLVMQDEARYTWSHAISKRKSDLVNGQRIARGRRLSVTFRKVIV
jgi:alkylated DNA repair dioxygenase AlkB